MSLNALAERIYADAKSVGWHTTEPDVAKYLANLHSEVSEAWEDYRNKRMETTIRDDGKPEGFGSELADILIRLLDTAAAFEVDIEKEVAQKMAYNLTRPRRHGGKLA